MNGVEIVSFNEETDWAETWTIIHAVLKKGDTYVYDPHMTEPEAKIMWMQPKAKVYVAKEKQSGKIVAIYRIRPNHPGQGSHIANASYMVHPDHQGKGLGTLICKDSLVKAKAHGFKAMIFNIVVSSNQRAVKTWEKCGFKIMTTIPKAFYNHALKEYVDAHIMYQELS